MRTDMAAAGLRLLSNDDLDARAALRLGGGVECESAAQVGQGFADGRVVVYAGAGRRVAAHTADGRWSPTRDAAAAFAVEEEVRRRGLEEAYVRALVEVAGVVREGAGGRDGAFHGDARVDTRGLFALIHASPRHRTIAALVAVGGAEQ